MVCERCGPRSKPYSDDTACNACQSKLKPPTREEAKMTDESKNPKLKVVSDEELDEDEREFRSLRRDLPGVKGASAVGIVSIGVSKIPGKHSTSGPPPISVPLFRSSTLKSVWSSSSSLLPTTWWWRSRASASPSRFTAC